MDIDCILADTKLQFLFKELGINADKQKELCQVIYENILTSLSTDHHLKQIQSLVYGMAVLCVDRTDSQAMLSELAAVVHQHSLAFHSITARLQAVPRSNKTIRTRSITVKYCP